MLVDVLDKKFGKNKIRVFDILVLIFAVVMSFMLRMIFIDVKTPDYTMCLKPWTESLAQYGGFWGLKYEVGNYTPAYMHFLMLFSYFTTEPLYAIKVLSILFDYAMAIAAAFTIAKDKSVFHKVCVFLIVSLLPVVITNSGVWGQCDAIYTFFILMALFVCMYDKSFRFLKNDDLFFICIGIAFSFKLQTVFVLPVIALVFLKKRYRLYTLLWIPAMYVITIIPSWIAGRGVKDLLTIYFRQGAGYSELQLNFSNLYVYWQNEDFANGFSNFCIVFCGLALVLFVYYLYEKTAALSVRFLMLLTSFSVLFITYFLPHMHDRYAYIAEITTLIYLFGKKKRIYIPMILQMLSLVSYLRTLLWFSYEGFDLVAPLIRLAIIVIIGMDLIKESVNRDEALN